MSKTVAIDVTQEDKAEHKPAGKLALSSAELREAKRLFKECDKDGNGQVDMEEFKMVMDSVCPGLDDAQVSRAFKEIDTDCSGFIDFAEFSAAQDKIKAWRTMGSLMLAAPEDLQVRSVAALAAWELPAEAPAIEPPRLFLFDALCLVIAGKVPMLKSLGMINGTMADLADVCMKQPWPIRMADAALRGASQVMMINNPLGGAFMIGALFIPAPAFAVAGLLGLLGATLGAFALRLDTHSRQAGLFGYNGVLVGLALATFLKGGAEWDAGILLMAPILGALSVVLQLALGNALVPTFKLPPATLAFNLVNVIFIVASHRFARFNVADFLTPSLHEPSGNTTIAQMLAAGYMAEPTVMTFGWTMHAALVSVGQVFLCQSATSGALILAGMAVSSRIAALAAFIGALAGVLIAMALGAPLAQIEAGLWGYNACLGAANVMIFFRPTLTSCIFSLVSAFLCVLYDGFLKSACIPLGMPVGTTPFCLAALTLLMTHGKIPGLHPIPLAEVATPEDHLIGEAAEQRLLKDA